MYIQNLITMKNTDIKIYGKFVNELVDNKLADAKQIYDEDYILIHPEDGESVAAGNFQNRINKDFKESITDMQSTIATHGYVDDKTADIVATIKATRYRSLDPITMKTGDPIITITDADGLYDKMVLGSKVAINYSDLIDANSNSDLVLYIGKKNVALKETNDQQQTSSVTTYTASFDDGNKKYILTVDSTGSNTLIINKLIINE